MTTTEILVTLLAAPIVMTLGCIISAFMVAVVVLMWDSIDRYRRKIKRTR